MNGSVARTIGRNPYAVLWIGLCLFGPVANVSHAQDSIEFLSGASLKGKVIRIEKEQRTVTFQSKLANKEVRQTYPYSKIHAVHYRGKRFVLNERRDASDKPIRRTPKEIDAIIERVGSTPPDWLEDTTLDYPNTLDLTWPKKAPPPWNNRKNVGQHIWDRVNPNTHQWRGGIKLMYHMLTLSADNKELTNRIMKSIGSMYFRFFQDYPRAAYWWRKAKVSRSSLDGVSLAECYFRLGNKRMAMQALDPKKIRVEKIKLLGNMGETKRALQLADVYAAKSKDPQWALLAAGDACRLAEDYKRAIKYYERVIAANGRNEQYERRARARAQQSIDSIRQFELLDLNKVADGEYEAETIAYEGPLRVRVVVKSGKIESVAVTKHKEKQYYSALRDIPQQIIAKQSLKDVDATSRATITAEAIVSATAKALVGDVETTKRKRAFR